MSRQDDFQNVQRCVIEPMTRMYHPPAHLRNDTQAFEEVIGEYHRALSGLPAVALNKGWAEVKADHKTWNWPHFQTIRDACEKYKPIQRDAPETSKKKDQFHCIGHAEVQHPAKAKSILSSPVGQLALKLAVGHDLMTQYEISGRTEFDEDYVRRCKQALDLAAQEVVKLTDGNPWTATWRSLFGEMMKREKRLYEEFHTPAERAA